ncbi:hypothetical protein [Streptomyces sp. NBC_01236]|uniref:hypothetical protein n=1 Tax=Streptomyces sp. NBC_01236 TaxID=2903789 RepID=UPI002E105904|nr:hypothetical protein OG324_01775 [Streptomyces sp. NBC_01236]
MIPDSPIASAGNLVRLAGLGRLGDPFVQPGGEPLGEPAGSGPKWASIGLAQEV